MGNNLVAHIPSWEFLTRNTISTNSGLIDSVPFNQVTMVLNKKEVKKQYTIFTSSLDFVELHNQSEQDAQPMEGWEEYGY